MTSLSVELPLPVPSHAPAAPAAEPAPPAAVVSAGSLHAVFDAMADIVCLTTADGTLRFLNRAGRDLLGYDDADPRIIGALFPVHSTAARMLLLDEVVPAALRDGSAVSDTALQSADGRIFPASQTVVVGPGDEATPATLTIVVRNIGLERQQSARMAESQRLFEMITRNAPDLIYLYDPDAQRVVWMNRCVHAFLGGGERDARTLSRRELERLVHRDDRDVLRETAVRMTAAYGDSDVLSAQFRIRTPGGSWRWVHTRANVFSRSETGAPQLVLGVAADITADRKEVQRIISMRDAAMQSSRIAHAFVDDLTTVCQDGLYAIMGLAAEVRDNREGRLSPREVERLGRLADHAAGLLATVSDVREYEQLESGAIDIAQTRVDVPALLADTVGALAPHVEQAGIDLALDVPPLDIPPVLTDAARLRQAVSQLVATAVRHAPAGALRVALQCDEADGTARAIEIRIDGAPAIAGAAGSLFEPFHAVAPAGRADRPTPASRFGLALTQALCQAIGCSLQHAASGRSVVFRIALPVPTRAARLAAAFPPAPAMGPATGRRANARTRVRVY